MEWEYDYVGQAATMDVNSGALTLAYDYDGDGRLHYLYRKGLRTSFLLDGRNVLREWVPITIVSPVTSVALKPRDLPRLPAAAYAQKLFDYTHGLGLISEKVTTLTTGLPSITHFYRWDGRSTTGRLEDPNRNVVNTSVYDAYGLLRNPITQVSAYGFVGEEGVRGERDQPPSLGVPYHMRARMYDPVTGRFTSRDPVWDTNLYEYGKGNPWSYVDPEGMQATTFYSALITAGANPNQVDPTPRHLWSHILSEERFDQLPRHRARLIEDVLDVYHNAGNRPRHEHMPPAVVKFWMDISEAQIEEIQDDPGFVRRARQRRDLLNIHFPLSAAKKAAIGPETRRVAHEQAGALREELEDLSYSPYGGEFASAFAALLAAFQGDRPGVVADLLGAIPGELYFRAGTGVARRLGPLGQRLLSRVSNKVVIFFRKGVQVIVNPDGLRRARPELEHLASAKKRNWVSFPKLPWKSGAKLPGGAGIRYDKIVTIDQMIDLTVAHHVEFALVFIPRVQGEGRYMLFSGEVGKVSTLAAGPDAIVLYHTHPVTTKEIMTLEAGAVEASQDDMGVILQGPLEQKKSVIINVNIEHPQDKTLLNVFDPARSLSGYSKMLLHIASDACLVILPVGMKCLSPTGS